MKRDRRQEKKFCILSSSYWLLAASFWLLACAYFSLPADSTQHSALSLEKSPQRGEPLTDSPVAYGGKPSFNTGLTAHRAFRSPQHSKCQQQDLETLTNQLLKDLPSYANRVIQRSRSVNGKILNFYNYVLLAGRPEFEPLTLGPGVYKPVDSLPGSQTQQVFITTLERQYTAGKPIELQQYHWLFFTQTTSGWRLAMMFTRTGPYPGGKPPTPPEETSEGDIAQAISEWLRDCRAQTLKNNE